VTISAKQYLVDQLVLQTALENPMREFWGDQILSTNSAGGNCQ